MSVDDPWSDFEWGEDWEVVDAAALPPPPEPPKTYAQRWAEIGIPNDIRFARKRLMAERKRRREQKKKIMVQHSTKISEQVSDALYDISEKYDVSVMKIMQKFIEDGIRQLAQSQGWSELLVLAGLEERAKPNPFEPLGSPAPVKETWTPAPQERFIPPDLPVDEFFPLPSGVGPKVGE